MILAARGELSGGRVRRPFIVAIGASTVEETNERGIIGVEQEHDSAPGVSGNAARSSTGIEHDSFFPPPLVQEIDGLANSGPPMPIGNGFQGVDSGHYGPSTVDS